MPVQADVSRHYTHGGLIEAIRTGIVALGKAADTVTVDDLAPVDEFHIGRRKASEEFLDQLGFSAQMHYAASAHRGAAIERVAEALVVEDEQHIMQPREPLRARP